MNEAADRTRRNLREQIDFEAEMESEARALAAQYLTTLGNMLATGPEADLLRRPRRFMRMWEDRAEQHRASHAMLLAAYTDT